MTVQAIQDLIMSWGVLLIPLTIALVALVKTFLPKEFHAKWVPLIGTGVGIILGVLMGGLNVTSGFTGLIIGLSAGGLFSLGKSSTKPSKT